MKNPSNDRKVLLYFFSILFIIWLIFDSLKYAWSDDPFQKVILAPLGEEPFKLLCGLFICLCFYIGLKLPQPTKGLKKNIKQKILFTNVFYYTFIPFSILFAITFGISEGYVNNILLHFSTTTIAGVLIISIFRWVKDKDLKTYWKIIAIYVSLIIPIFLHSIMNQYVNIIYADNHPQFGYLVVIGRYLVNNTFLVDQTIFSRILFYFTLFVLIVWIINWIIQDRLLKKKDL